MIGSDPRLLLLLDIEWSVGATSHTAFPAAITLAAALAMQKDKQDHPRPWQLPSLAVDGYIEASIVYYNGYDDHPHHVTVTAGNQMHISRFIAEYCPGFVHALTHAGFPPLFYCTTYAWVRAFLEAGHGDVDAVYGGQTALQHYTTTIGVSSATFPGLRALLILGGARLGHYRDLWGRSNWYHELAACADAEQECHQATAAFICCLRSPHLAGGSVRVPRDMVRLLASLVWRTRRCFCGHLDDYDTFDYFWSPGRSYR